MRIAYLPNPSEKEKLELSQLVREVISPLNFYSEHARKKEIEKFSVEKIGEFAKDEKNHILIIEDDGKIVAFLFAYDDGEMTFIIWYGVAESHRGRGIGQKILNALKTTTGSEKIWCDTNQKNAPSNHLLTKCGFSKCASLERFWYGHDYFLWELPLYLYS